MSGKFLSNSILLKNADSVIDVIDCRKTSVLVTEKNSIKEVDIIYQKQIKSWSSNSWEVFTCGAITVPTTDELYVVTNHNILWKWHTNEDSLENVKKVTFKSEIKKLLMNKEIVFVLFKSGFFQPLADAIKSKKKIKKDIIGSDEEIEQIMILSKEKYCMLIANKDFTERRVYVIDIESSFVIPEFTIHFNCESICKAYLADKQLLSLCSNGEIYSKDILNSSVKFPGLRKDKLYLINTNKDVNIIKAGDHVVFHGRAIDDGDYLILWNYKYNIAVHKKRIKMSVETPMGWSLNEGIALVEGNTLGYVSLELKRTTAAIMMGIGVKDGKKSNHLDNLKISDLSISDENCSSKESPTDKIEKLITTRDLNGIINWLNNSHYMSEKQLVSTLSFALEMQDDCFNNISSYKLSDFVYSDVKLPYKNIFKFMFINSIIATPCTRSFLLIEISKLEFEKVLILLEHFCCLNLMCQSMNKSVLNPAIIAEWTDAVVGAHWLTFVHPFDPEVADLLKRCYETSVKIENTLELYAENSAIAEYMLENTNKPFNKKSCNNIIEF